MRAAFDKALPLLDTEEAGEPEDDIVERVQQALADLSIGL